MITQQNLSLYQLSERHRELLARLYDPETGEVDLGIDAELNALSDTTEKKCIAITNYLKQMEAEKQQINFYKTEILNREKAYESAITRLQNYLKSNMERQGIKKIECPQFTLQIKANPYSTEILDEAQIPEQYMRSREIVKTEVKPDKNAIKEEVLKTGVQIPGALVAQKTKLEILTDKI